MRYLIVGWFGSDNLGDELLLHSLVLNLHDVDPAADCAVMCPNPIRVSELHEIDAVELPTLRSEGAWKRLSKAGSTFLAADAVLLGPGTIFQERSPNLRWPGTLVLFLRIVVLARLMRKPVFAVGVAVREGLTPIGRVAIHIISWGCRAIGTRDKWSARLLGRESVTIGDMAYALRWQTADHRFTPGSAPKPSFVISFRPLAKENESGVAAVVREVIPWLTDRGLGGRFLAMAHGRGARLEDDLEVYNRYFKHDELELVDPLASNGRFASALDSALAVIHSSEIVLATRLHAALLSIGAGIPTIGIAYERKVQQAFDDLGLGDFVHELHDDSESLISRVEHALDSQDAFIVAQERLLECGKHGAGFVLDIYRSMDS